MDISDGLFSDLNKMLISSQLSAQINYSSIPIHPEISNVFPELDFDSLFTFCTRFERVEANI